MAEAAIDRAEVTLQVDHSAQDPRRCQYLSEPRGNSRDQGGYTQKALQHAANESLPTSEDRCCRVSLDDYRRARPETRRLVTERQAKLGRSQGHREVDNCYMR